MLAIYSMILIVVCCFNSRKNFLPFLITARRISFSCIKTSGYQNQLWIIFFCHGQNDIFKCQHVLRISESCTIPWNVNVESFAYSLTNFVKISFWSVWIELSIFISVNRNVEYLTQIVSDFFSRKNWRTYFRWKGEFVATYVVKNTQIFRSLYNFLVNGALLNQFGTFLCSFHLPTKLS